MIAPLPSATLGQHSSALENLTGLLAEPLNGPLSPRALAAIQSARAELVSALVENSSPPPRGAATEALICAAESLVDHPAHACAMPAVPEFDAPAGWFGVLVRLFAAPAWQTTAARQLEEMPVWLWPLYARHLFAAPSFFADTAQEERWAAHVAEHLDALVHVLNANPGSAASRGAAQIVSVLADGWPWVGSPLQVRQRLRGLARLRRLLGPRLPAHTPVLSAPLPGAPLRVALVCENLADHPDAFAPARLTPLLDTERIELAVRPVEDLPGDLAARVAQLRAENHEAIIFAGDLTASDSPVAAIAQHRIAPLQFATAHNPRGAGLPEIDFLLTDAAPDAEACAERLARLPAALAFEPPPPAEDEQAPARADLGLPAFARLLVASVHPRHATAAVRDEWQRRLSADHDARLILLPACAGPDLDALLADCERRWGDRLILAGNQPLTAATVAALLRVCDDYLPTPHDHQVRDLAALAGLPAAVATRRLDCLAFAEALTEVLEASRANPASEPCVNEVRDDLAWRRERARDLLAFGRADRAVQYLLAAVDDPAAGAEVWHELGAALQANGQSSDAVQALETCVRMAPDRLDSWLLLADWASDYGHAELLADITTVVRDLAPEDPRVLALAHRVA